MPGFLGQAFPTKAFSRVLPPNTQKEAARRAVSKILLREIKTYFPKNKIEACKWFLLIAPKNPAAKKHVVRMHEELESAQFTEAVLLARKIDPNLFVPSFVPVPPAVAKPRMAELGAIELPAVDALAVIIDRLAKGRAETLWEALPKPYLQHQ